MACYLVKKDSRAVFGFIHIYKNGGMSIRKEIDRLCENEGFEQIALHGYNTKTEAVIDNRFAFEKLGVDWWMFAYKFTTVRCPYSRLVSFYHFIRETGQQPLFKILKTKTFEEFVYLAMEGKVGNDYHQTKYLEVDGEIFVDRILHLETLETDLKLLSDDLKIQFNHNHINTSNHNDWKTYFTKKMLSDVYDHFRKDFENFGYSQQGSLIRSKYE